MEALKRLCALGLVLCLCMAGCARTEEPEMGFRLNVATNETIARISYEYDTGGEVLGGGVVQRADETPMEPGENVTFSFFPEDFPDGAVPENVNVSLIVWGCSGEGTPVDRTITVRVSANATPEYTLLGDASGGYRLVGPT